MLLNSFKLKNSQFDRIQEVIDYHAVKGSPDFFQKYPSLDSNLRLHGRTQEGLDPLQKILSRALAAVQIFSEGVQTLLGTPLLAFKKKIR